MKNHGTKGLGRVYRPVVYERNAKGRKVKREGAMYWTDFKIDGRRFRESTRTTDHDEACRILAERRRAAEIGAPAPEETVPNRIGAFVEYFLTEKGNLEKVTPGHLAEMRHQLQRAAKHFGAERKLASITPEDVHSFDRWLSTLKGRKGRPLSGQSRKHHMYALSGMFSWAAFKRVVAVNPVASVPKDLKPQARPKEQNWLEVPDAALLLEAARTLPPIPPETPGGRPVDFAYPLLATFLMTGARRKEILGMLVEDVHFDRNRISIRPSEFSEGNRLKTKNATRTLHLHPQLKQILQAYVYGGDRPPSKLLFPSYRTGREAPLTTVRSILGRVVEHAIEKYGALYIVDEGRTRKAEVADITVKSLRPTYCSARLQTMDNGEPVSIWTVVEEMGHADEKLVRRVYGHLGEIRHRSKHVEFRIEQHKAALKDRGAAGKYKVAPDSFVSVHGKQTRLASVGRRRKLLRSNARP